MISRLLVLYKATAGGHKMLSEENLTEYAGLRKGEFEDARRKLQEQGMTDIHPVKDPAGDIVGWSYQGHPDEEDY